MFVYFLFYLFVIRAGVNKTYLNAFEFEPYQAFEVYLAQIETKQGGAKFLFSKP